jgi:hypothetical protein
MAKKYILKESSISIYVGDDDTIAGSDWDELPEVFNLEKGSQDVEEVDVTSFSSPGDARETLNGYKSFSDGTLEFYELIGDPIQQRVIDALGGDPIPLRIEKTDGIKIKRIEFLALIKGESEPLAPGDAASLAFTIKRTGPATITVTNVTP